MLAILFVCHGNTCRSVLAEHLARHRLGPEVRSSQPASFPATRSTRGTQRTRCVVGLVASAHVPRALRDVDTSDFDIVVAMEPAIAKSPELALVDRTRLVIWNIRDPWGGDPSEYDRCALSIVRALAELKKHFAE